MTIETEVVATKTGDVLGTFDSPALAASEARKLLRLHGASDGEIEGRDGFSCFLRLSADAERDPHPVLEPDKYRAWCQASPLIFGERKTLPPASR